MTDIFDEVTEDLRRQQMLGLWRSYGKYLIAAAVAIVIGVGGYQYWRYHARTVQERESAAFAEAIALLEQGKTDDGLAVLAALQETAGGGYRLLAGLREAAERERRGDTAAAIKIYERLATDKAIDETLRGYAELQAVAAQIDQGDAAALRTRLEKLAAPNAPWSALAEEFLALLDLKAGNVAAARERLDRLAQNEDAPAGARTRAGEILATLPQATESAK